jgi:hypothetical protein
MMATLFRSQVACSYGRRGRRILLSGEARMEYRLRVSVEEGRSDTLGRSIGGRGLSVALLYPQASSLSVSASDRMLAYRLLIK